MKKSVFLLLFCFSSIAVIAQQRTGITLSKEAQKYWDNAMIYMEEAKNFSERELAINELEKLIKIQEYPDAFLELGKLYGKGYVSSWINRSEECFRKYAELCPNKKDLADKEKNKCEIFRNMRKKDSNKNSSENGLQFLNLEVIPIVLKSTVMALLPSLMNIRHT